MWISETSINILSPKTANMHFSLFTSVTTQDQKATNHQAKAAKKLTLNKIMLYIVIVMS